jgi:hypothetical protein
VYGLATLSVKKLSLCVREPALCVGKYTADPEPYSFAPPGTLLPFGGENRCFEREVWQGPWCCL